MEQGLCSPVEGPSSPVADSAAEPASQPAAAEEVAAARAGPEARAPVREAGVGLRLKRVEGRVTVVELAPGGSAAGLLHAGERLCAVDGRETGDMRLRDVLALLRGREGSAVQLLVERPADGARREVALTRGQLAGRAAAAGGDGAGAGAGAGAGTAAGVPIGALHDRLLERLLPRAAVERAGSPGLAAPAVPGAPLRSLAVALGLECCSPAPPGAGQLEPLSLGGAAAALKTPVILRSSLVVGSPGDPAASPPARAPRGAAADADVDAEAGLEAALARAVASGQMPTREELRHLSREAMEALLLRLLEETKGSKGAAESVASVSPVLDGGSTLTTCAPARPRAPPRAPARPHTIPRSR